MFAGCLRSRLVLTIALLLPAAVVLGQAGEPVPPTPDGIPARPLPPEIVRYDGHMVVRAQIRNLRDLRTMLSLSPDVWTHGAGIGEVDFRIPPEAREALDLSGVPYTVLIEDMQPLIEAEQANRGSDNFFDAYRTNAEMIDFMEGLVIQRPDLVSMWSIGRSIENRPIYVLRITGTGGPVNKPAVFFNYTQHAREWVSGMAGLFMADRFVSEYGVDPYLTRLLDDVEFFLVPMVNPDGYIFSWTNNRMWRKNRRDSGNNNWGVDLNRNWGYMWGGQGSSGNPGSQTYRGTAPFSEPETAAMRDFIIDRPNILGHIDYHNYSQLILQPWSYTTQLPPHHAIIDEIGSRMARAMTDMYGQLYRNGPGSQILYITSGGSRDWTYGAQGIIAAFGIEMRDRGTYGFLLPPAQIVPASEEALVAGLTVADWVRDRVWLSVSGECGTIGGGRIDWNGAEPNSTLALIFARNTGEFVVPIGNPCQGTTLGLGSNMIQVARTFNSGPGNGSFTATLPTAACGGYLQLLQASDCATSNVAQIPQ